MSRTDLPEERFHASAIALKGKALLILGPSGSGKSTLALDLMALGAELISDDQTLVRLESGELIVRPHPNIAGRIEARHVGLFQVPYRPQALLSIAIDLGTPELHRLPPARCIDILGQKVTLLHRPPGGHAASALLQCLMQRRQTP